MLRHVNDVHKTRAEKRCSKMNSQKCWIIVSLILVDPTTYSLFYVLRKLASTKSRNLFSASDRMNELLELSKW
jgi:hypothetical protein